MQTYLHMRLSAFNCAKCTLHKDIFIIVNIQLHVTVKTVIHYCLKFKFFKATLICAHCKFNNIKRIFFFVIRHFKPWLNRQ